MTQRDTLLRACAHPDVAVPDSLWDVVGRRDGGAMGYSTIVAFLRRDDVPRSCADSLNTDWANLDKWIQQNLWRHLTIEQRVHHIAKPHTDDRVIDHAAANVTDHAELEALVARIDSCEQLEILLGNTALDNRGRKLVVGRIVDCTVRCTPAPFGEGVPEVATLLESAMRGEHGPDIANHARRRMPTPLACNHDMLRIWLNTLHSPAAVPADIRPVTEAVLADDDPQWIARLLNWMTTHPEADSDLVTALTDAAARHATKECRAALELSGATLVEDPTVEAARAALRALVDHNDAAPLAALVTGAASGNSLHDLPNTLADAIIAHPAVPAGLAWSFAGCTRNCGLSALALLELRPDDADFATCAVTSAPADDVLTWVKAHGFLHQAAVGAIDAWATWGHNAKPPEVWERLAAAAGEHLGQLSLPGLLAGAEHSATLAAKLTQLCALNPSLAVALGDTFTGTVAEFAAVLRTLNG